MATYFGDHSLGELRHHLELVADPHEDAALLRHQGEPSYFLTFIVEQALVIFVPGDACDFPTFNSFLHLFDRPCAEIVSWRRAFLPSILLAIAHLYLLSIMGTPVCYGVQLSQLFINGRELLAQPGRFLVACLLPLLAGEQRFLLLVQIAIKLVLLIDSFHIEESQVSTVELSPVFLADVVHLHRNGVVHIVIEANVIVVLQPKYKIGC